MAEALERTVSASEFKNRAGRYIEQAASGAVVITRYDRPSRVLVDYEEYSRLQELARSRPTRQALAAEEMGADLIEALETAEYDHIDPELNKLMG